MKVRVALLATVLGGVALAAVGSSAGAVTAKTAQAAADATSPVIVVLNNQVSNLPATPALVGQRANAVDSTQQPLINQLASSGARDVQSYTVLNAVSADVSASEQAQLQSNPAVAEVVPDGLIHLAPAQSSPNQAPSPSPVGSSPQSACAPTGQVQLDPQALEAINADSDVATAPTARSLGATGAGVTVAFIADGVDIKNPDFLRNGKSVFTDYEDFSGEGLGVATGGGEAFLDASSIAAQGNKVYDVSHYSDLPLGQPCLIRVEGVAPGASLVGLDIFGKEDTGFTSEFLQAIDYAVATDHVNVLNESLGNNYYPDDQADVDVIKQANDQAVAAGTTVVVSTGDAGVTSTIGSPSSDPNVISAGASTTYRTDRQIGFGGGHFAGVTGWLDNNISSLSAGGFEPDGETVDVVAPGEYNWALCSTDLAQYSQCADAAGQAIGLQATGGTSESAPLTAGVAALVIQAFRSTHGGQSPTPAQVKQIITSTADDIGAPADQQGSGIVDAYRAVLAARNYGITLPVSPGSPSNTLAPPTFLTSPSQLHGIAPPGTPERLNETITNNSGATETLSVATRALGAYSQLGSQTVTLSDASSPKLTDWQGISDNYQTVSFVVPPGENRLNAAIAFQNNGAASGLNARVRLTLIDSQGRLAAYSVPQGDGNYGDVQVTNPAPGRWTAYVYSRNSAAGGTQGTVLFGAGVATYQAFGSVSPQTLTLAPHQSAPVTLTVQSPGQPGDSTGAILITPAPVLPPGVQPIVAPQTSTIPVTLRSLIPARPTTFNAVLTGGNGRASNLGETFYYELNMPAGVPEVNASITLPGAATAANNPFDAWLVDPQGDAVAFASNTLPGANGNIQVNGAQLHALSPAAGNWTLIVAFAPAVSGTALSQPFTVQTDEGPVLVTTNGLPNSATTRLKAGKASSYTVTLRNTGPSPELYFLDARLPTMTQLALAAFTGASTTEPLTVASNFPVYLVPPESTAFVATASTTGTQPIQFDTSYASGDPDIASNQGTSVSARVRGAPLAQGIWSIAPVEVGPFGPMGGPMETVDTTMTATTQAFDPAVSSPTGDLWQVGANLNAPFDPVVVNPGQTVSIPVTITPSGPAKSVVSGTLYVDDASLTLFTFSEPTGDQIAAIPYSYKIKK